VIPFNTIPWRLIGYGVALAAFMALGWRVHVWHESHKALPGVEAALEAEVACGEGSQCQARQAALQAAAEAKSAEVVAGYEQELADLRNRPLVRRVIRVCNDGGVQSPGTPGSADGASPAGGELHGAVEFDTGPLRNLAREADEVAARLRALQGWNEALSAD
jgi:hypothetical protein